MMPALQLMTLNSRLKDSAWAEVKLNSHDTLLVGVIYRSPGSLDINNALLNQTITDAVSLRHSHLLLLGDFNFPGINWDSWSTPTSSTVSAEYYFLENIRNNYLFQHVTLPTRGRVGNLANTLDLVFTNEQGMIDEIIYESPLGKSDHSVLLINYRCYAEINNCKQVRHFYDRGDYTSLVASVDRCDWDEVLGTGNVNTQWTRLKRYLKKVENEFIPHKLVGHATERKGKIPLDKSSIRKIKKKHTLWKRFMETNDGKRYTEYCRARNQVRALTRKLQKQFEVNLAHDAKTNPKAVWKYMNSKTKTREGVSDLNIDPTDDKSRLTISDKEKADVLGGFFSSVFTIESNDNIPHIDPYELQSQMIPLPISEEIIKAKLEKLNIYKSMGPDGIHPRLLKELAIPLSKPLARIFNKSLIECQLPDDWKQATVSAIYKKGSRNKAGNYRPVSLTCILCKVMEGCIRDQLVDHITANNLFSNSQFGFIKGRSTGLQLLNVMDLWTKALDNSLSIDTIYLDFMKAFDTVPHRRLVHKLAAFGIINPILGWVNEFLTGRVQQVCVSGTKSEWAKVSSGIPQGSVLGPVLFVLYINDLPSNIKSNIFMFADDTKLFRTIETPIDQHTLQDDLNQLTQWSRKWLLKFHPNKCKVMHIGKAKTDEYRYTLNVNNVNHELEYITEEKDIGVIIDCKLEFDKHVNFKINKASGIMAVIRRSFITLNESNFVPLYKALVRSHLDYASHIWSPYKQKYKDALENVQRRATKQINGMKDIPYPERLKRLKLPTLAYRRIRGDMVEMFKLVHGKYDKNTSHIVKLYKDHNPHSGRTRGHVWKVCKERNKLNIRNESFPHRAVQIWNCLPENVVKAENVNLFKNRLDTVWSREDILYDYKAPAPTTRRNNEDLTIEA